MSPTDSIAELLIQHAETRGEQIAFSGSGRAITYADLAARTGRIAGHLASTGIGRGHHVLIILGSRVEAAESILAVTRTCAIGVPLDPRSSPTDLAEAWKDVGARTAITDRQRLDRVRTTAPTGTTIVVVAPDVVEGLLRYDDLAERDAPQPAPDDLGPDEPAWFHYTSGTTGRRKGVLSCQRAWLWSALFSFGPALGMTSEDRLFWPLPLFHAFGHGGCIIATVAFGVSTYLLGDEPLLDSLQSHSVNVIAGVPTTYRELLAAARNTSRPLPRVRACFTGGAPPPAGLSAAVENLFGVPLLNRYGCTETCGAIAANRPGDPYREDTCGAPLPGVEVRLVALDRVTDVTDGEDGEIWVRSPGLMLGYHDEPQPPFIDGWYLTGDVGRRTGSGHLAVTGRLKELIIRGGENIHPAEVDRVLLGCPGVADVVVAGVPHYLLGEVPAAFIVPVAEGADPVALLAACRAVLPDYKVPAAFYEIDAVPRTASGKTRRGAVSPRTSRPLTARSLGEDSIELMVLTETASTCGLAPGDRLDPDRPFTDWGVTSLVGMVIRDRLAALTGQELPATLVFDYPTPAAVSRYLRGRLLGTPPEKAAAPAMVPPVPFDSTDPIAIVSMACRYPGGISSPEDLWRVVSESLDVTSDFPDNRGWDLEALYDQDSEKPGTSITRRGGFIHDMAEFDAGLFHLSPREALATDPQQRLLLETSWELAERAGIAPSSLRGTNTGVFVGVMYNTYSGRFIGRTHDLEAQLGLGSTGSVAAGRISYVLGLHGPSLAVDTACSSSLVTLHLAAASLRTGECSLAIAGGVTIMAAPQPFVVFSRQHGLSPDGRCRSYSADADGTAWSEGVGLLLLERLSDAQRNGHRVLGLVRGTATNSDGPSNGLTAPSGPAQQEVIRQALAQAGLLPADVDVVEGHGTATVLGDPIEVQALMATYGSSRPTPMLLGSVKSNIGHTQAAAGVAGVIKMVKALEHSVAPATLHITEPSRHVDWASGAIELLAKAQPWPRTDRPRRAAVSAFGISGANAHVILEQSGEQNRRAPTTAIASAPASKAYPWLLSGADEAAMQAQARAVAALSDATPADVAFSLATTRSALAHRSAVPPGNHAALMSLAEGRPHPDVVTGKIGSSRLIFLFSGQGSQRPRMGQQLRAYFPAFDQAFRAVCEELDPRLERPLAEVIRDEGDLLGRADFAQAAIFAYQVAMCRLLQTFGMRPDYLAGHSVGEVTAAHIAGVFTLADAAALIAARGALMSKLPSGGAMATISATEEEVAVALSDLIGILGRSGSAVIAAVNARRSVVVSGTEQAVVAVMDRFAQQGRQVTQLRVSHAFHSPLMDPILDDLGQMLRDISFGKPEIPLISTVTGKPADAAQICSREYWIHQVGAPVRFADAVSTLATVGASAFVEIGPSAALATHVPDAVLAGGETNNLLDTLGRLHVRGIQIDWRAIFKGSGARVIDLPVYPFQRSTYWLKPPSPPSAAENTLGHPILLHAAPVPGTSQISCSGHLSLGAHPWLGDHVMGSQTLLPAAAFAELALRAGHEAGCNMLEELVIVEPLTISSGAGVQIQVTLGEPQADGARSIEIYSRQKGAATQQEWTRHCTGAVTVSTRPASADRGPWPLDHAVDITGAYATLADAGIGYGPAFQCVRAVWRDDEGLRAHVQLSRSEASEGFLLHPALLDAALHVPLLAASGTGELQLPFVLSGVRIYTFNGGLLRAHVRELGEGRRSLTLTDQTGALVAEVASVTVRAWQPGAGDLYRLEWTAAIATAATAPAPDADIVVRIDGAHRALSLTDAVHGATAEALSRIRQWSADQAYAGGRFIVVTERGTVDDPDMVAAAVWGLTRSTQAEFGDRIVLVDLDGTEESAAALPRALASGQTVVAVRSGKVMVPRLGRLPPGASPKTLETNGTVLITGGTGGLGALLSRHLARVHNARHLLLISRSGPDAAGAHKLRADLASGGAEVCIEACDATDRAQLAAILARASPPVSAVVHAAGVVDDALLDALTQQRVSQVLRPKVDAAWNLHELLPNVSSFVLFSSVSGVLGNRGQAGYAAGNCFLDALARSRVARGLSALSLAWGPWYNEAGMNKTITRGGALVPLTDQQGLDLFDAALRTSEPVVAPLVLRGPVLFNAASKPLFRTSAKEELGTWREQLAAQSPSGRRTTLLGLVQDEVGVVLGYQEVPDRSFTDLGMDSFTGVLLRNRLSVLTGIRLAGTLVLDHASIPELTDYLLDQLAQTTGDAGSAAELRTGPTLKPKFQLASLYRQLCQLGHSAAAADLLAMASLVLPTFGAPTARAHAPAPQRLATGPAEAALVCFPDLFPQIAGISVYRALAAELDGERDVFEMPYPVTTVPEDLPTLASMHAETIREHFADRPLLLLGYSAGGCTAHAVATRLASPAVGMVLIDTYLPARDDPDWLSALSAAGTARAGPEFDQVVDDTALAAMGAHLRISVGWQPGAAGVPVLFLRARDPTPQMAGVEEWRAAWPLTDHTAEIPGNHLELLHEHVGTTAAAIRSWTSKISPSSHAVPTPPTEVVHAGVVADEEVT